MGNWWVNHKQTFKHENAGGYIWSPQRASNGAYNKSYDNLTLMQVHDTIFSHAFGMIQATGKVTEEYQVVGRPTEFGETGRQWDQEGWLVRISWVNLIHPLIPKNYLSIIAPLLPEVYSPIQINGNGNQNIYLASISSELSEALTNLSERQNPGIITQLAKVDEVILDEIETKNILSSISVASTQKTQLIQARVGQGLFRQRVQSVEKICRLTGVSDSRFLIASHIKPWRDSTNSERLDAHNGLLLSPHVDKLFDYGWISFSDKGEILLFDESTKNLMTEWGLDYTKNVGSFTSLQKVYLDYHRKFRFRA